MTLEKYEDLQEWLADRGVPGVATAAAFGHFKDPVFDIDTETDTFLVVEVAFEGHRCIAEIDRAKENIQMYDYSPTTDNRYGTYRIDFTGKWL